MAPIYVKGGIWTNVEDEILKAAIAKYGLNQWSRVSSLLNRKNAKQCKLRWQEWLNPTIKKLDWTIEEDSKLLNLIKLRPNQWNSISLLLNRTSNQCIERYQELLIDNEKADNSNNDLKLIGNVESTGNKTMGSNMIEELNLNPESRPARPDFEDMDDEEKEMISEARARLANTQGKKAKRKAREKILNESKRVALLQRRRELKQVGIKTELKQKKTFETQMDYNADIAFERRPEAGKFDTEEEAMLNEKKKNNFDKITNKIGTLNQEVSNQMKKEKRRRQDNKRLNERVSRLIEKGEEMYDLDNEEDIKEEFRKKRKLNFSEDNEFGGVGDDENENLDDRISEATKELVERSTQRSVLFSRKLNKDDDNESGNGNASGDENASGNGNESGHENGNENGSKGRGLANRKDHAVDQKQKMKEDKKRKKQLRLLLIEKLKGMPEPLNDFDIIFDEEAEDIEDGLQVEAEGLHHPRKLKILVDEGELERKETEIRLEKLRRISDLKEPQAIKMGLPLPTKQVDVDSVDSGDEVQQEMVRLINGEYSNEEDREVEEHDFEDVLKAYDEVAKSIQCEMEASKGGKDNHYYRNLIDNESQMHTDTRATQGSDGAAVKSTRPVVLLIKRESKESLQKEQEIKLRFNELRESLRYDKILDSIGTKISDTRDTEDEIWIQQEMLTMETVAIEHRRVELQNGIEELNMAIDKKRQKIIMG